MDLNKTALPLYFRPSKAAMESQNKLKTHVNGAMCYGAPWPLLVWIDYGGMFSNTSNLLCSVLMALIRKIIHVYDNPDLPQYAREYKSKRPDVLYINLDNAAVNKSKVFLGLCAMLVWRKVFRKVILSIIHINTCYTQRTISSLLILK